MNIQTIVIFIIILIILRLIYNLKKQRTSLKVFVLWLVVWLIVGIIFWQPDIASRLALITGIGRGADVIVYSSIIVILYLVYRIFVRLDKINSELTVLVRDLALKQDKQQDEENSHTDSNV